MFTRLQGEEGRSLGKKGSKWRSQARSGGGLDMRLGEKEASGGVPRF